MKEMNGVSKGGKVMRIILCVLAVLLVGGVVAAATYANNVLSGVNHVEVPKIDYAMAAELPEAAPAEEAEAADAETTEATEAEEKADPADYQNFLVVSKPVWKDGTSQTNTMILVTMNKDDKTMTLTSLQADALVEAPAYGWYKGGQTTLNKVYGMGATYGGGTAGAMTYINQVVYNNFGIEVDKNFELDLQILSRIVTRLDHVKVNLSEAEAAYLTGKLNKEYKAGEQNMDGNLARTFISMWSDEEAEDIDVLAGQRKLLEGIVMRIRSQYVENLEQIVKEMMPSVTTSMTWKEFRQFLISLLPMVRTLSIENGGTCPVEYEAQMMDVDGNGTEEEVLVFDVEAATKAMRAITKGEK